MHVLYGNFIRKESGVEKTLKKIFPPLHKFLQIFERERHLKAHPTMLTDMVDKAAPAIKNVLDKMEQKIDNAHLRSASFNEIPILQKTIDMYTLSLPKTKFMLGESISFSYKVPEEHGTFDWIAIYKTSSPIEQQMDKLVSKTSSKGCWMYLWGSQSYENEYLENKTKLENTLTFLVDRLPFDVGEYEMRIHYNNTHRLMTKSQVFSIYCDKININQLLEQQEYDLVVHGVSSTLLVYIQYILNKPDLVSTDDLILIGDLHQDQSKRICAVITKIYGVDIAFKAIGEVLDTVESIAEKTCEYVVEVGLRSSIMTRSRSRSPSKLL